MNSPDCLFAAFGFVMMIILISLLVIAIGVYAIFKCVRRRRDRKNNTPNQMESRRRFPRRVVAPSYLTRTLAALPPQAPKPAPDPKGADGFEQVKLEEEEEEEKEEVTWRPRIYVSG